jgi:hypothetical protein
MGGSSSSLSGGESYSLTAEKGKKLSDDILHLFFSNANLLKLLKLHNIAECPRFVFTTSDALATQFQRLQVYPKLGKRGEILFAPIGDLAPGLFKEEKVDAKAQEKIHERNALCIDVGYFYVRILQIYSALALTTLNADPLRVKRGTRSTQMRSGPQNATLLGGARPSDYHPVVGSGPLMVQLGGAIPKTGPFKALYDSIVKTPLEPLVGLLKPDGAPNNTNQIMHFDDTRSGKPGVLYVNWTFPSTTADFSLEGEFKRTNSDKLALVFSMKRTHQGVVLLISTPDGRQVEQELKKSLSGWEFVYSLGEGKASDPHGFFDKIYEEFTDTPSNTDSTGGRAFSSSSGSSISIGSVSGSSSFEGFEQLKKLFQDTAEKGSEFPKAYCVARAMTLLNPLFSSELLDQRQPYFSQVCRSKFDFETTEYMPRPGKSARANMYLKSFVSLYYDDYKYNRSTGKIELTQSEPSAAELRKASVQFARMYNIQGDQEGFLSPDDGKKSAVNFTGYPLCAKGDKLLRLKTDNVGKELFASIQSQCIKPMLEFQESHTIAVNKLLMKMFIIETTKLKNKAPEVKLRLQPAIKVAGRDGINAIGKEAHDLLLNYYLKSEAFYIRGIYLMNNSPTAFDAI